MKCENAQQDIVLVTYGELPDEKMASLEQHLADCEECNRELKAMLAMHEALEKLALESPQKAEIVKLHYFTGLEYPEIARALGVSLSTVERGWAYARSWLYREMKKNISSG